MAESIIKEIYDDLKKSRFGKVAMIFLLLVLSLFTVWSSLPDSTKEKIISGERAQKVSKPEVSSDFTKTSVDPKVVLEKLAAKWLAAWLDGDVDTFVNLASEPFYFDKSIVLTRQQLRSQYLLLQKEKGESWRQLHIDSIKVQTARELKEQGYDLSKDRIFPSLNLTLDDYAVTIISSGEGMVMMARQLDESFEIVGVWD